MPRKKPTFKYNKNTGVYILKEGKGRINWYRYQEVILKLLLLSFAKECLEKYSSMLVQEDRALSHLLQYQQKIFDI